MRGWDRPKRISTRGDGPEGRWHLVAIVMTKRIHDTLLEYLKGRKCQTFRPHVVYHPSGDFIEVYWEDVFCIAEPHDDFILMRAEDGRVVGCKIGYGISRMIEAAKQEQAEINE